MEKNFNQFSSLDLDDINVPYSINTNSCMTVKLRDMFGDLSSESEVKCIYESKIENLFNFSSYLYTIYTFI